MRLIVLIIVVFVYLFGLNAHGQIRQQKSKKLKTQFGSFNKKLVCDRYNHVINANVLNFRNAQIEIITIFRPEFYIDNQWRQNDTMSVYSIYNNYSFRYSPLKKLEFQFGLSELIMKAEKEIREYAKTSMNTQLSLAIKYSVFKNKRSKVGIFGKLIIPKADYVFDTYLTPEIRLLYTNEFRKNLNITFNIGEVYLSNIDKGEFLYALELKSFFWKKYEVFAEFYNSYTNMGPFRMPNKRILIGSGCHFIEDIYSYVSIETGWEHEDYSLNDGRIDFGITCRFKR